MRQVSESELRRLFNTHYLQHWRDGNIREAKKIFPTSRIPDARRVVSTMFLEEIHVATCVYFLYPDDSIAASGLPDPKYVYVNGVIYKQGG